MAQFDSLIIFPLIWSLLFVLFFYYSMSIEILIPSFFGTKKFREKKFSKSISLLALNKPKQKLKNKYSYSSIS